MVVMQPTWSALYPLLYPPLTFQAARFPEASFPALKTLIGQSFDSSAARSYSELYPAVKLVKTDRNTIGFELKSHSFTVEELVAMEFINMRKNAELMADGGIRDTILTVPPFFNQAQRTALSNSAKLAGLRPIELLNDGLAVALDYAKARTFEGPQVHVIFDMGAGSTSATVVRFASKSVKDVGRFNKTITTVEVLGSDFNVDLSGNMMSTRLYKHLKHAFHDSMGTKLKSKVETNPRALARLLKEATRVKQILSANNEATVSLESLHEDLDFRYKLTRTAFEELVEDLGSLTSNLINDVLHIARLKSTEVQSLILHGGAARVPFVQQALLSVVQEHQIARNVNADEAAVMGAVFRGAGLSGSFRVKDIQLTDSSQLAYTYTLDQNHGQLFERSTPFGTQRNLTLSQISDDFRVSISAENGRQSKDVTTILSYDVIGVVDATAALVKEFSCVPDVLLNFMLDHSGMISLNQANVTCEIEERSSVTGKLKGWFGAKDTAVSDTEKVVADGKNSSAEIATKDKKSRKSIGLKLNAAPQGSSPLTKDEHGASIKKISFFEKIDHDRVARETARNELEAYIYKVRDLLENESFLKVSTSDEQKLLQAASTSANEWMNQDGDSADLAELVGKKHTMADTAKKIIFRRQELGIRQGKIEALQKQISSSRTFVKSQLKQIAEYTTKKAEIEARAGVQEQAQEVDVEDDTDENKIRSNNKSSNAEGAELEALAEPLYTEDELSGLEDKLDRVESWLSKKVVDQSALSDSQDPVLLTRDIINKTTQVSDDFMAMLRKITYREQAKSKTKASAKSKTKPVPRSTQKDKKSPSTEPKDAEDYIITEDPTDAEPPQPEAGSTSTPEAEKLVDDDVADPEPAEAVPQAEPLRDEL